MSQLTQDILAIAFVAIFCEKLFSISSRIYESHKSFDLTIIRAIMIVEQHNFKKNKLQHLYLNLENKVFLKKLKMKYEMRIAIVVIQSIYISNDEKEKRKKKARRAIANACRDRLGNATIVIMLIRAQTKIKSKKRTHFNRELISH